MKILTEKQFVSTKETDTLIIYGCGSSINKLKEEDKVHLSQFDSLGYNWFCKSGIKCKYYIVREQANIPVRITKDEKPEYLIDNLNSDTYKDSILIIHNLTSTSGKCFQYHKPETIKKFSHKCVVIDDLKLKDNAYGIDRWSSTNIFKTGVFHGRTTMNNALHIAVFMGYKKIVFVGVDLSDSRYFWLGDKTRESVKKKGRKFCDEYFLAKRIMDLIQKASKTYNIDVSVYNRKSLLRQIMPVYSQK
jgi:hypothetical protein